MRKILFFTAFLGLGLSINLSVSAQSTAAPQQRTAASSSQSTSNNQVDQGQWAAWMIQSKDVADGYVKGLDSEQYEQSWTKGDDLFKKTITQQEWARALNDSRKRLGNVISRKLKDQRPAIDPHGLPKGAYMVVEYNTSFQGAPDSGELLTLRRGDDGVWRILTYQVN